MRAIAGARLWAILEPRSNTLRRNIFQKDLASSLAIADEVIVAGVFRSEAIPETNGWTASAGRGNRSSMAGARALLPEADGIVQSIAPELRSGDVVAILSNGGFGGIYEKLPARLRELSWERQGSGGVNLMHVDAPIWPLFCLAVCILPIRMGRAKTSEP